MRVISHSVAFPFLYPFPVVPVLFSPVDAPLPSSVLFRGLMRGKQVLRWPAIHQLHQHGLSFPSISMAWLSLPSAWPGFPFHQLGLAFPSISFARLSLSIRMGWLNLPSNSLAWLFLPSAWPGFSFHQHGLAFFPSISLAWLSLPLSLPSPPLPQSLHFYPSTLSSCLQYCSEY